MSGLESLGLALGVSFSSGLNLYATVAVLGLLHRFDLFQLPPSLEVLAHPVVLGIAIMLYVVEFLADKVPYMDTIWDLIHTLIRPPAAAVLAYGALGNLPETWRVAAALLGGGVALTSHGSKASTRAAVNASPEPLSNWALSLFEDGVAVFLVWLAATHPFLTAGLVLFLLALSAFVLVKLYGYLARSLRRAFSDRPVRGASA